MTRCMPYMYMYMYMYIYITICTVIELKGTFKECIVLVNTTMFIHNDIHNYFFHYTYDYTESFV